MVFVHRDGRRCDGRIAVGLPRMVSDDIGLWLLVEAYFQSQRPECVPILERMLRNKAERDEPSVKRMEDMIEEAKAWNADRRG